MMNNERKRILTTTDFLRHRPCRMTTQYPPNTYIYTMYKYMCGIITQKSEYIFSLFINSANPFYRMPKSINKITYLKKRWKERMNENNKWNELNRKQKRIEMFGETYKLASQRKNIVMQWIPSRRQQRQWYRFFCRLFHFSPFLFPAIEVWH